MTDGISENLAEGEADNATGETDTFTGETDTATEMRAHVETIPTKDDRISQHQMLHQTRKEKKSLIRW